MNNAFVSKRTSCRLCNSPNIQLVLPIKPSPIADAFVSQDKKNQIQPSFPLDLYQCQNCGHVQNIDIVNPNLLFRDYIFLTGSSTGLIKHFSKYARDVISKLTLNKQDFIVEIGSNDGTLLNYFKELGMQVLGIDPAIEIAVHATNKGIKTLPEFFNSSLAEKIIREFGKAQLIVANNVYAHSDALADMTKGIESLLEENGVFVFEVSYLLDIIDKFLFDTVYHEHLSYHSISPLQIFFKKHNLHLFDVERVGTKGGSIRVFVQKINGKHKERPIIARMIAEEEHRGLHHPAIFKDYEQAILKRKSELNFFIDKALKKKKRVVGYGASTTVTTLMYHFELENKLEYLIDDNAKKHSLLSPGCHLEVRPSTALYEDRPDIVIVLAWQYANVICSKHNKFIDQGGVFVVPLPDLKTIASSTVLSA